MLRLAVEVVLDVQLTGFVGELFPGLKRVKHWLVNLKTTLESIRVVTSI